MRMNFNIYFLESCVYLLCIIYWSSFLSNKLHLFAVTMCMFDKNVCISFIYTNDIVFN